MGNTVGALLLGPVIEGLVASFNTELERAAIVIMIHQKPRRRTERVAFGWQLLGRLDFVYDLQMTKYKPHIWVIEWIGKRYEKDAKYYWRKFWGHGSPGYFHIGNVPINTTKFIGACTKHGITSSSFCFFHKFFRQTVP